MDDGTHENPFDPPRESLLSWFFWEKKFSRQKLESWVPNAPLSLRKNYSDPAGTQDRRELFPPVVSAKIWEAYSPFKHRLSIISRNRFTEHQVHQYSGQMSATFMEIGSEMASEASAEELAFESR